MKDRVFILFLFVVIIAYLHGIDTPDCFIYA